MSTQRTDAESHELAIKAKRDAPPWEESRLQAMPKENYLHLKHFLGKRQRTHHGKVAFGEVDHFISSVGDIDVDWRSLLLFCNKTAATERYLWSADYWSDSTRKEGVAFVSLDDHLLISRGLYKTALARYALHYQGADSLQGVKVSRWSVEWEMYGIWLELKDICAERFPHFSVTPEKKKLATHREGHSVIDEYLVTLRREDARSGKVDKLGSASAKEWLYELAADSESKRFSLEDLKALALAA